MNLILKNKKLLERFVIDIIFYLFIGFGLPSIFFIGFTYKLSTLTTAIIYSVLMIIIVFLKTVHDTNNLKKILIKED